MSPSARGEKREWSKNGWDLASFRGSIMTSRQIEQTQAKLGLPLPEMIFGDNQVSVTHAATGWNITFNTIDALDLVDKTGKQMLQVAHSKIWQNARKLNRTSVESDAKGIVKPYDWTYTTNYRGTIDRSRSNCHVQESDDVKLPLDLLKRHDPILFFESVSLFEDELGDNGIVTFDVKVRAMSERIFILSRQFLRLDDVIFRVRDTRVVIELAQDVMIREYKEYEDTYQKVKSRIPAGVQDFGKYLRDVPWVVDHLPMKKTITDAWKIQ